MDIRIMLTSPVVIVVYLFEHQCPDIECLSYMYFGILI